MKFIRNRKKRLFRTGKSCNERTKTGFFGVENRGFLYSREKGKTQDGMDND